MQWPLIRHLPARTNLRFVRFAIFAAFVSIAATIASIGSIVLPLVQGGPVGLNLGIDFKGGTLVEMRAPEPIDLGPVRSLVSALELGDVQVQGFTDPREAQVRFEAPDDANPGATVARVKDAISQQIPGVQFTKTEVVGAKVSDELLFGGVAALGAAIVLMLIYIWFRFEWQFGLGAVFALFHDVVLTLGVFSFTKIEFTLNVIAALLTIIGYSMNDTVVIFDRIRENLRKYKRMPLRELVDLSVNETLSRTILTGCTTLTAVAGLLALGGEALFGFTFAILFGVIVGTYSSVYVAAPVILLWGVNRGADRKEEASLEAPAE